jgi:hypothetical protein
MIPLKLTPEERRAIWTDYCRRRNWARAGIILVLAILFLLRKSIPYLPPWMLDINWASAMAVILVPIGIVVSFYLFIKRWTEWKCPNCGNKFALGPTFYDQNYHGWFWPLLLIGWKSIFSSRCAYCGKPAKG